MGGSYQAPQSGHLMPHKCVRAREGGRVRVREGEKRERERAERERRRQSESE